MRNITKTSRYLVTGDDALLTDDDNNDDVAAGADSTVIAIPLAGATDMDDDDPAVKSEDMVDDD